MELKCEDKQIQLFLENKGVDFLCFKNGSIVVSTYHDKQFTKLGGDTNLLISFFEDYGNMEDAIEAYLKEREKR